jgi:hypothetical protein
MSPLLLSVAIETSHLRTIKGKSRLKKIIKNKAVLKGIRQAQTAGVELVVAFGDLTTPCSQEYLMTVSKKDKLISSIAYIEQQSTSWTWRSIWLGIGSKDFESDLINEIKHLSEVNSYEFELVGGVS